MTSEMLKPLVIIIMGVAGSGKTTIGKLLAERLGWQFVDADSYHSAANIQKMSEGIALTDEDRAPWLLAMHDAIAQWIALNEPTILACSALKNNYRDELRVNSQKEAIVYLQAPLALLTERLKLRKNHFMKASMLESQFQALEEPVDALFVDAARPAEELVDQICQQLRL